MAEFVIVQRINYQDPAEQSKNVQALIQALCSTDGWERHRARALLVELGEPAVEQLTEALTDPRERLRWEAAEALSEMCNPRAAPALVQALEDRNSGVRWIAADALIGLGRRGLPPLLKALMQHSESRNLRDGAHHVLHALSRSDLQELLAPVLAALDGVAPAFEVPHRAHTALHALRGEVDHRLQPSEKVSTSP